MIELRTIEKLPPRLFAIGDIHGCVDEARTLLSHLQSSLALNENDLVVFIGDYIDRGPDSKGVVDLLLDFKKTYPSSVFLKGNHEDMLLGYLGMGGNFGANYMYNGGVQFLRSYDISSVEAPENIVAQLPPAHLRFFQELLGGVIVGDYVFVHAGVNPLKRLEEQEPQDLFWIRDEFIMNIHRLQKTVVFGHTPFQDVMFHLPYKIGIDTGLYYGNLLTCIETINQEVYQIARKSEKVVTKQFKDFPDAIR
jgi:serine/threonine protein phosphatase 1